MRAGKSIQELIAEFIAMDAIGLQAVLLQAKDRGVEFDLERSVRVDASGVFPMRLLVSFESQAFHQAFSPDLFLPFTWMNLPNENLNRLRTFFPKAWRVHFGWELGVHGWIGKIYLELHPREIVDNDVANNDVATSGRFEPGQLLFLGYKWPLSGTASAVVSKYKILTHLPAREALEVWKGSVEQISREFEAEAYLNLVECLGGSCPENPDLLVLEVADEGSQRVSYDINLYDLEQSVESIQDVWMALFANSIPDSVQQAYRRYLGSIAQERVGHMACGLDRSGSTFWTLYYGACRVVTR